MSTPTVGTAVYLAMLAWTVGAPGDPAVEPAVIARDAPAGVEVVFLAGGTTAFPSSAHCYAVIDTAAHEAVVIDPGPEAARAMRAYLDRRGVAVRYICVTHAHVDHLAGLGDFLEGGSPRVVTHRVEVRRFPSRWRPRPEGARAEGLNGETFLFLTDRQTLECGRFTLRVLLTPGHTIGSQCYELVGADLIFVGDTIFRGNVGRTDLADSAGEFCLLAYAEVQLLSLPESVRLLPGHGDPTTVGHELRYNPFFRRSALGPRAPGFDSVLAEKEADRAPNEGRCVTPQRKGES